MIKNKSMLKKVFALICVAGFCVSVNSATNARLYALGQPFYAGDILLSAYQGWQMLGYPDQMQGSFDYTGTDRWGPVILIKSVGENVALGATLNTTDKRTKGSVLASTGFVTKANEFTIEPDPSLKQIPTMPQYHFGIKIGEHKIGVDAYFETQNFSTNRSSVLDDTTINVYTDSDFKLETKMTVFGGKISGRFAFGNFAWNPWFSYGVPYLDGTVDDKATIINTSDPVNTITTKNVTTKTFDMNKTSQLEDMFLTFGSCFDYTFGDKAWAIIGGWYRNETWQYRSTIGETVTTNGTVTFDTLKTALSPRYNNIFVDYFAALTPKIFDEFLIGFEYQGGFSIYDQTYEDHSQVDTTLSTYWNSFIINMEKPMHINRKAIDVFTVRGALRYEIGRIVERTEQLINGGLVVNEFTKTLTTNAEDAEGMAMFLGFGYKLRRVKLDLAVRLATWKQSGLFSGPYPGALTMTVDLHKKK